MAKIKYSKYDVYSFLDNKQVEITDKKLKPIQDDIKKLKENYLAEKFPKEQIEKIKVALINYVEATRDVQFDYSTYASKVYDSSSVLVNLFNTAKGSNRALEDQIMLDITSTVDWSDCPDLEQLKSVERTTRSEIREEFQKLEAMVKRCKDGAQAVLQLQKLGFDTSSIKPTSGDTSVLVLNLNNDLLGLPEENSEVVENSQF